MVQTSVKDQIQHIPGFKEMKNIQNLTRENKKINGFMASNKEAGTIKKSEVPINFTYQKDDPIDKTSLGLPKSKAFTFYKEGLQMSGIKKLSRDDADYDFGNPKPESEEEDDWRVKEFDQDRA